MKASSLPNRHKHLCLFKLGYDVHALLSSVYVHPLWQEDYCCVPNITTSVRSEHHTGS
jgi:hypothetical protein